MVTFAILCVQLPHGKLTASFFSLRSWYAGCNSFFLLLCKWAYSSEMMSSRFVVDLDNNFTFQKTIMLKFVFRALIEFLFSELRKLNSIFGQFVAIGKLMMGGKNNHHVFWEVLLNYSTKIEWWDLNQSISWLDKLDHKAA